MLQDYEVKGEFQDNYRYAHDYWSSYIRNAQVYALAASGYTWSDQELNQLQLQGRDPLELNIMRRPLQFFSGYLRDNLKSIVMRPIEGSDEETADQGTKLQYYIWDKENGYPVFLDSCDEAMKAGMSLCGIQMDYSKDFINGDISFFKRTYNQFVADPTFERIDLEDASFVITRDLINRQVAKQLLQGIVSPEEIDSIQVSFRDNKFLTYHPNFTTLARNRDLLSYDQYYKRISKTREFLVDTETNFYRDITDLEPEKKRTLKNGIYRIRKLHEEADSLGIDKRDLPAIVEIKKAERNFIEMHIMLNGVPVYQGEDRTGINTRYPFVMNMWYFEPSIFLASQRVQGIPSTLYSAQRQFNKRHMKIIDMMDSTISTGFKLLLGSVPDISDLQQSGQNKIIGVESNKDINPDGLNAVQELQGGNANPALMEYQKVLDDLMLTLANVNESVLGIDDKGNTQISGRLAQVRIGQGLRSNRKPFDNIEEAQKQLAILVWEAIQKNYPAGKIKRILGEDPTQQFYDQQFEQYDVAIEEGVRSQSQKDAYYYELVNLKREGIVDVPEPEIVGALKIAGITDLKKSIEERYKQQQQAQQQTAQLQMQLIQKEAEVLDATKEEKYGLAGERRSRERSNIGLEMSREADAEQKEAQAELDRAKTIIEIAKLGDNRMLEVLNFLHEKDKLEHEKQKAESEQELQRINAESVASKVPQAQQATPQQAEQ